jgi:hypothetical protein
VDTFNKYGVSVVGQSVAVLFPVPAARPTTPFVVMSPDEAMMFAAWLIVMARIQDMHLPAIDAYVEAVQST